MMAALAVVLALALAFSNGANDNGKGVASLVAYDAATPGQALVWAAVSTAIGSLLSALWGTGLLRIFSAGFVETEAPLAASFFVAVLAAASLWVLIATRYGLPVSTTHAITGALLGAGLVAAGTAGIAWGALARKFAVPLAAGPLVSLAVAFLASRPASRLARRVSGKCTCVLPEDPLPDPVTGTTAASARSALAIAEVEACAVHDPTIAIEGTQALNALHWGTSGLVGFARGWNDTPKIAALALVALPGAAGLPLVFSLVALAMAVGGLTAGRRVLHTLAKKVTPLPLAESLTASASTAALVSLASFQGLPLSTTHVATGAIVGAGAARDVGDVRWRVVRDIVLSWIVTLPAAALFALLAYGALR